MKKSLLCPILISAICGSGIATAQETFRQELIVETADAPEKHQEYIANGKPSVNTAPVTSTIKSNIDLAANECWWGYFTGEYGGNDPFEWLKIGWGEAVTYACCIKIPADNEFDIGRENNPGIKFAFPDVKNIDDVQIWMSHTLPVEKTMGDADICVQNIDKADLTGGLNSTPDNFLNEIRFDEPYTITDKDVYIGYTFRVTKIEDTWDESPVVLVDEPELILGLENAFMRRYDSETEWDIVEDPTYGVLAMQVLLSGEDKNNALDIAGTFNDVTTLKNSSAKVPVQLSTIGKEGVSSFKYTVKTNGTVSGEQTANLATPVEGVGAKFVYEFPLSSGSGQGVYNTEIAITEVNGHANEVPAAVCLGDVIVLENESERKVFVEDYTGTREEAAAFGFVNKVRLEEIYGDQIVIVSPHIGSRDPMRINEYKTYTSKNGITSVPSVYLDRSSGKLYPYTGSNEDGTFRFAFPDDIEKARESLSSASVEVTAVLNDDETAVEATTTVNFGFSGEKANFALFYVLTQDGLSDESRVQKNGMGQYAGSGTENVEPLLEPWINGPSEVSGVVYDDVVVAAAGLTGGIDGSISQTIEAGAAQTHRHSFALADCPLVKDKTKLTVSAVLIDKNSGKVINADGAKVAESGSTSVEDEIAGKDAVETERYTIDGRKITAPAKGINIIRYSNGSVVKQLVK